MKNIASPEGLITIISDIMAVKRWWHLLPSLCCLAVLGCGTFRQNTPLSPEMVLQRFRAYSKPISYASRLKLSLNLKDQGSGRTELLVYHRSPEQYSFFLKDFWGNNLMIAYLQKDSILVFYPQDKAFIFESIELFAKSDYWKWEVTPLQLLKFIDGSWFSALDEVEFVKQSGQLFEYQTKMEGLEINFALSGGEALLRSFYLIGSQRGLLAYVSLKNTRKYKGFFRPGRLEVRLEDTGDLIKIGVVEEKFNLELPDKYFQAQIPDTAKRIFLN